MLVSNIAILSKTIGSRQTVPEDAANKLAKAGGRQTKGTRLPAPRFGAEQLKTRACIRLGDDTF